MGWRGTERHSNGGIGAEELGFEGDLRGGDGFGGRLGVGVDGVVGGEGGDGCNVNLGGLCVCGCYELRLVDWRIMVLFAGLRSVDSGGI